MYASVVAWLNIVIDYVCFIVKDVWEKNQDCSTREEFAKNISGHPYAHILFDAWDGKINHRQDVADRIKPNKLIEEVNRIESYKNEFEKRYHELENRFK